MNLSFVFNLAWRESRASRRRFALLVASVATGVAALVAINGFTENLRGSIADQAKALLGADLSITGGRAFPARIETLVDTLTSADSTGKRQGQSARVISMAAMAYVTRTTGARLVQVKAIEPGYPYYGEIVTNPLDRWPAATEGGKAVVDPALLTALGAEIGDTIAVGEGRFEIAASVTNMPGNVGVATSIGPRVFIAAKDLPVTQLLRFGSRADYEWFIKLTDPSRAPAIAAAHRGELRRLRFGIHTVESDQSNLADTLGRLGRYLGLVALIALLLGGLGVASATHLFIRQRLETIAVLRCLGATSSQIMVAYLGQAAAMGVLGSLLGAGIGIGLQWAFPLLVKDFLPVDVDIRFAPESLFLGVGLGIWVAVVFAILPLLAVRRISPLATLRRLEAPPPARRDPLAWLAFGCLVASVVGLSAIQVRSLRQGLGFSVAIGVVIVVLSLAAHLLIWAVRRWLPRGLPYLWRQGLANLFRPANQTGPVVVALGFGAFLLSTLFLVQYNLLREFRTTGRSDSLGRPNLIFYDIQPDQVAGVLAIIRELGAEPSQPVPIVPMRIKSIKGVPVPTTPFREEPEDDEIPAAPSSQGSGVRDQDSGSRDTVRRGSRGPRRGPRPGWATRREYRSTYRDSLDVTEKITLGSWWTGPRPKGQPARISVERAVAEELGVTVGDDIVWDVQGIAIPTRVANIREVDWNQFRTNFFVVFEPGVLESAPQMSVTLTRIDSAATRGSAQRRVAERYSNVSALDLSLVQQAIESVLDKAMMAVRFLALFSLASGTVVLLGAVTTARIQRIREGILLKTLGATRRQVLRIQIAEFVALGLLAAAVAIGLSATAGWALSKWVFKTPYHLPLPSLAGLTAVLVSITLLVGLWSSAEVLKRPPLEVLRSDT